MRPPCRHASRPAGIPCPGAEPRLRSLRARSCAAGVYQRPVKRHKPKSAHRLWRVGGLVKPGDPGRRITPTSERITPRLEPRMGFGYPAGRDSQGRCATPGTGSPIGPAPQGGCQRTCCRYSTMSTRAGRRGDYADVGAYCTACGTPNGVRISGRAGFPGSLRDPGLGSVTPLASLRRWERRGIYRPCDARWVRCFGGGIRFERMAITRRRTRLMTTGPSGNCGSHDCAVDATSGMGCVVRMHVIHPTRFGCNADGTGGGLVVRVDSWWSRRLEWDVSCDAAPFIRRQPASQIPARGRTTPGTGSPIGPAPQRGCQRTCCRYSTMSTRAGRRGDYADVGAYCTACGTPNGVRISGRAGFPGSLRDPGLGSVTPLASLRRWERRGIYRPCDARWVRCFGGGIRFERMAITRRRTRLMTTGPSGNCGSHDCAVDATSGMGCVVRMHVVHPTRFGCNADGTGGGLVVGVDSWWSRRLEWDVSCDAAPFIRRQPASQIPARGRTTPGTGSPINPHPNVGARGRVVDIPRCRRVPGAEGITPTLARIAPRVEPRMGFGYPAGRDSQGRCATLGWDL